MVGNALPRVGLSDFGEIIAEMLFDFADRSQNLRFEKRLLVFVVDVFECQFFVADDPFPIRGEPRNVGNGIG